MTIVKEFFRKYYSENHPRKLILGINPGRFGAGITGINFTAPRQLKENCNIDHPWKNSSELSAEFIYQMIDAYGGPDIFYKDYFLSAVSPLGFTRDGRNINYYDDKALQAKLTPFIVKSIKQQLSFGIISDTCFIIGGEKNYRFLNELNNQYSFFNKIIPLAHPRFIMQYRRKELQKYIGEYLNALQ